MTKAITFLISLLTLVLIGTVASAQHIPLGHSHNDYYRDSPMYDALAAGFTHLEVDVMVVYPNSHGEELRVAHVPSEWQSGRNLESLYLDPLVALPAAQRPTKLTLQVETKIIGAEANQYTQVPAVYNHVKAAMEARPSLHSWVEIVFIGKQNYPTTFPMPTNVPNYLKFSKAPDAEIRGISPWPYTWTGIGDMPVNELAALADLVVTTQSAGKKLMLPTHSFESTGDPERVWSLLAGAGVDIIATDDPARFRAWQDSFNQSLPPDEDPPLCYCPCE